MADLQEPIRVYHPLRRDLIDADVVKVLRRLRRYDHEAYLVGGCVRDLLLGVTPKDFDVATAARPQDIRALFRNSKVIGRRFRLAHIFFRGGKVIEVATFRQCPHAGGDAGDEGDDLLITDDNVFGTPAEDAERRDFTINGLFYDVHGREIVDHVQGLQDIGGRVVRAIGDPDVRVQEDPVRGLRAVKFASRLGLQIDPELWRAIVRHREEILRSAAPRVCEEILRVLRCGQTRAGVQLLARSGLLSVLLPEVSEYLGAEETTPVPGGPLPGPPRAEQQLMWRLLDRLDALTAQRGPAPDHLLLSALLYLPLLQRWRDAGDRPNVGELVDDLLVSFARRLRMPRRCVEQVRQTLIGERRLAQRRRRSSRRSALQRRPCYAEALALQELTQPLEEDRRAHSTPPAPQPARKRQDADSQRCHEREEPAAPPGGAEQSEQPRRSRRRRRPRRRRRGGSAAQGAETPAT